MAQKPAIFLLDLDEVRAIRDNITDAKPTTQGPPARVLPESLCAEVEKLLTMLAQDIAAFGSPH